MSTHVSMRVCCDAVNAEVFQTKKLVPLIKYSIVEMKMFFFTFSWDWPISGHFDASFLFIYVSGLEASMEY